MSEIIDFIQMDRMPKNDGELFTSWLLWAAMCSKVTNDSMEDILPEIEKIWPVDSTDLKSLEICLTINGIEVPIVPVMARCSKTIDHQIFLTAKEMVEDKFCELINDLHEQRKHIISQIPGYEPDPED